MALRATPIDEADKAMDMRKGIAAFADVGVGIEAGFFLVPRAR
jgi:hypothetical protein